MASILECNYCVSDNEIGHDEDHVSVSTDEVVPTPEVENISDVDDDDDDDVELELDDVEEALLMKLPGGGEKCRQRGMLLR